MNKSLILALLPLSLSVSCMASSYGVYDVNANTVQDQESYEVATEDMGPGGYEEIWNNANWKPLRECGDDKLIAFCNDKLKKYLNTINGSDFKFAMSFARNPIYDWTEELPYEYKEEIIKIDDQIWLYSNVRVKIDLSNYHKWAEEIINEYPEFDLYVKRLDSALENFSAEVEKIRDEIIYAKMSEFFDRHKDLENRYIEYMKAVSQYMLEVGIAESYTVDGKNYYVVGIRYDIKTGEAMYCLIPTDRWMTTFLFEDFVYSLHQGIYDLQKEYFSNLK